MGEGKRKRRDKYFWYDSRKYTISVVTVQRLKNEDRKRRSEALKGTTMSEGGGKAI